MVSTAFTLAETLITLGIIGIVAALTIPNMIAKVSEKRDSVRLKKVYASLTQAYKLSQEEFGDIKPYLEGYGDKIDWYDNASHEYFGDYFMHFYNGVQRNKKYSSSWKTSWKNGASIYHVSDSASFAIYNTLDGAAFIFRVLPNYCTSAFGSFESGVSTCGEIFVDLHSPLKTTDFGTANTNRVVGKNVFLFHATAEGIVPAGTSNVGKSPLSCYTSAYSCAAWVLKQDNMNYLHKTNLGW